MGLYDIIIVGAGPAGLTLASLLEKKYKILLVDQKKAPYTRIACGEWAPPILPVNGIQNIKGMITEYAGLKITFNFKGKIIHREKWQKDLMESLQFTEVHTGERVVHIENGKVRTNKGIYNAKFIVGADGPFSVVRRCFNLPVTPILAAINARVNNLEKSQYTHIFFMKEIEKGYGWYFPKGEEANVGVGTTGNLKETMDYFINHLRQRKLIGNQIIEIAAGAIPLYPFVPVINRRTFLIGDAAGLTDPLTGAGIYQAWDSARMLSELLDNKIDLSTYNENMTKTYGNFLKRRMKKRKILEKKWPNIKEAVEKSWISTFQG